MLLLAGMVVSSLLADRLGILLMLALGGGFYALAGVVALVLLRKLPNAPLPTAPVPPDADPARLPLFETEAEATSAG